MNDRTPVTRQAEAGRTEAALMPPVDVIEDASGITLYADLPGVSKDKLNLHIEADTITIEGALNLDVPEGMEATHAEVSLPNFRRVVTLPDDVDPNAVNASYRDGVLHISIQRREAAQPRRISIQ